MKTWTMKHVIGRVSHTYVYHRLAAGEVWADYNMDQPNPLWSHHEDWPYCPLCTKEDA